MASNVETGGRLQPHKMNPPKPKKMGWKRMLGSTGFFAVHVCLGGSIQYMLYQGVLKESLQDDDMLDDEDI